MKYYVIRLADESYYKRGRPAGDIRLLEKAQRFTLREDAEEVEKDLLACGWSCTGVFLVTVTVSSA
jgi:hypothetical protein